MRFQLATVVALSLSNVEALRPRSAAVGALYHGRSLNSAAALSRRHGPDGDDEDGMPKPKSAGGAGVATGSTIPPTPPSDPMSGMNMPAPARRSAHGPEGHAEGEEEPAIGTTPERRSPHGKISVMITAQARVKPANKLQGQKVTQTEKKTIHQQ